MSAQPARRVFLHVGLHKTGTTYVQQLMRANRAGLRSAGVLYPGGEGFPSQVLAVFDLLGRRPRGAARDGRITGAWQTLVDRVHATDDATVWLSDEHLSLAGLRQVRAAVGSFPGAEVHAVVTARDLARVLASSWQESVKNRGQWAYADYAAAVRDPARAGTSPARGFWLRQDLPAVLATWARVLPVQRVHVVTVPPTGAAPDLLVQRLLGLVDVHAGVLTSKAAWANETVGLVGTEVIRRVNPALDHLNQRQYDRAVKLSLVRDLAERTEPVRFTLPPDDLAWAQTRGREMADAVRTAGHPVTGDLSDLDAAAGSGRLPDQADDAEVLAAALAALAGMVDRYGTAWWANKRPDQDVEAAGLARGLSTVRAIGFRAKRAAGRLADDRPAAGRALASYLRRRRG